jgi:HAD superfamily hydrolase (TIGR01509 family)
MTRQARPAAVVWDLDGTIIDSEEYWIIAETEIVESFGGTWSHEDGLAVIGQGLSETALLMQERGVKLSIGDITSAMTTRVLEKVDEKMPWRPGAPELVRGLFAEGVPLAIATMAYAEMAHRVARAISGVTFGASVAGDQVTHSKPDPEIYLLAAQQLGVDPSACVAIEDSPVGVTAASRAGLFTIGVPLLLSLDDAPTSLIWPTLAERTPQDIFDAFREDRSPALRSLGSLPGRYAPETGFKSPTPKAACTPLLSSPGPSSTLIGAVSNTTTSSALLTAP